MKRKVDKKFLNLLDKVDDHQGAIPKQSSDYEMQDLTEKSMTDEQKEAIKVLSNKSIVFNQNEAFQQSENN